MKPPCRTLKMESELEGMMRLIGQQLEEGIDILTLPSMGWLVKQRERM